MKLQTLAEAPQLLQESIEQHIRSRTGGMIRGLKVEIFAGEVILTGRTATYYNKQLATHAVLDAAKGLNLTNDIEVF